MAKPWARSFYKSNAWKYARKEALRRDGYTCRDCCSRAEEVHHIIELTPSNINDPRVALNLDNLMSLCHDCHSKRTLGSTGDIPEGLMFDEMGRVVRRYPPPGF